MSKQKIDDLIFELQQAHSQINKILYNNQLNEVHILIERGFRKRRMTLGTFLAKSGFDDNKSSITLWTAGINGNIKNILAVLLHEMVHQYNFENNQKDVENNGRHNKRFKQVAEEHGLETPEKQTTSVGYGNTSLSKTGLEVIKTLDLNLNTFNFIHDDSRNTSTGYKKRSTYKCLGCGLIITNSNEIFLRCMKCNLDLIKL